MNIFKIKRKGHPASSAKEFLSIEDAFLAIPLTKNPEDYNITVIEDGSPVAIYNGVEAARIVMSLTKLKLNKK